MSYFRSFFKKELWQAVGATFTAMVFARHTLDDSYWKPADSSADEGDGSKRR